MKILVACEESQTVCKAFRAKGHEAYSCDILPCSGGHPEWHFQINVELILPGFYKCHCGNIFDHTYGKYGCCSIAKWYEFDMVITFPPCDHLAVSGSRHFKQKIKNGKQQKAIDFFMLFANHPCKKVCIENPVGIMSTRYKKPTQIIQPYYFGEPYTKTTCLWLKGLPKLIHSETDNLFEKKLIPTTKEKSQHSKAVEKCKPGFQMQKTQEYSIGKR